MVLDATYFPVGSELYLPMMKTNAVGVEKFIQTTGENTLEWYIDKYEREFLQKLLGKKLVYHFIEGIKADPVEQRWENLKDAIYIPGERFSYSAAANYVYFFVTRRAQSQATDTGEVRFLPDFTVPANVSWHLSKVWNDMRPLIEHVMEFLGDSWNDYREYAGSCSCMVSYELLCNVNSFNI